MQQVSTGLFINPPSVRPPQTSIPCKCHASAPFLQDDGSSSLQCHSPRKLKPGWPVPILLQMLKVAEPNQDSQVVPRLQQPEDVRYHSKNLPSHQQGLSFVFCLS